MKLAEAYNIPSFEANNNEEAIEAVKKAIEINGPTIIQLNVDKDFIRI